MNFLLEKIEFWTHSDLCAYDRMFGVKKGPAG